MTARLLANLRQAGFQTVGPRLRDEGIVYAAIESMQNLPRGEPILDAVCPHPTSANRSVS